MTSDRLPIGRRGFLAALCCFLAGLLLRGRLRPTRTRPPEGAAGGAREALFYRREERS